MNDRRDLTLLTVHAHPDDESVSMGATLARYSHEGVRTVLVTCTGGEVGPMLDPDRNAAAAMPRLAEMRRDELACAVKTLGIHQVTVLGYRDWGMVGTPDNTDPRCFLQADFGEATRRLVEIVRREKPQVLVTYNENGGYGHPDHIMAHRITVAAFEQAGDPACYPELDLAPWQPSKLYYTAWARRMARRAVALAAELNLPNPFEGRDVETAGTPDDLITTEIEIAEWLDHKRAAWRCYRTQITDDWFFLRVPVEKARLEMGREFFVRARSLVDTPLPEDDLFSGLRR